jgi:hypothetical protein
MLPATQSAAQSATQADAPGGKSSATVPASPAPIEQLATKERAASAAGRSVPKTNRPGTNPPGTNRPGTNPPGAKIPAKVSASRAPIEQPQKTESAAPGLEKQQASPPLDLASLENRLKQTKAIGVFSKLALKNQIDDLLNQFRAYYQGHLTTTLAQLRQRYDLLLLKVLTLLQDSDQSLATAIGASREAIWAILANRQTFATI